MTAGDSSEIGALLNTAIYDTRGESVEGAFVDRWEKYSHRAIDELYAIFERRGFSEADAAQLRQAVSEPAAPIEPVIVLVAELGRWTYPLLQAMRDDSSPRARTIAVLALCNPRLLWLSQCRLDPEVLRRALSDSSGEVREAAVETLGRWQVRDQIGQAKDLLAQAVEDEAPRVRISAGASVDVFSGPEAAEFLAGILRREPDEEVRQAVFLSLAKRVKSARRTSGDGRLIREQIGEPLTKWILEMLDCGEAPVRRAAAQAAHRIHGEDVASALLSRLRREPERDVREALLQYPDIQYVTIRDQALPVFTEIIRSEPIPAVRAEMLQTLESFEDDALPILISTLEDSDAGVRFAAIKRLGALGGTHALLALLRGLSDPAQLVSRPNLLKAIRQAANRSSKFPPPVLTPELSAAVQRQIDALLSDGPKDGPGRDCLEQNALPLHGTLIYLWALQPNGTVLCMDHEAFTRPTEPETDPLTLFAVMAHGAQRYSELESLLPAPPDGIEICGDCNGRGYGAEDDPENNYCLRCRGLGWLTLSTNRAQ